MDYFDQFVLEEQYLNLLKYQPLKTCVLTLFFAASTLIGVIVKVSVIKYLIFNAQKERPINTLMLIDQVILSK